MIRNNVLFNTKIWNDYSWYQRELHIHFVWSKFLIVLGFRCMAWSHTRWEDNIKRDFVEIICEDVGWIDSRQNFQWQDFVNMALKLLVSKWLISWWLEWLSAADERHLQCSWLFFFNFYCLHSVLYFFFNFYCLHPVLWYDLYSINHTATSIPQNKTT
jgi:hypothetical protein